jgi:hypothetical protein
MIRAWLWRRTLRRCDDIVAAVTAGPTPPENVLALMPGGQEIPVECIYKDTIHGIHRWTIASPQALPAVPRQLTADRLPPNTSVLR